MALVVEFHTDIHPAWPTAEAGVTVSAHPVVHGVGANGFETAPLSGSTPFESAEHRIAAYCGASAAALFPSVGAAIHTVLMQRLDSGDQIVVERSIVARGQGDGYHVLEGSGVAVVQADNSSAESIARAVNGRTRLILVSGAAPLLPEPLDQWLRERGCRTVVACRSPYEFAGVDPRADLTLFPAAALAPGRELLAGVALGSSAAIAGMSGFRKILGCSLPWDDAAELHSLLWG